jgi:hypothetical protein
MSTTNDTILFINKFFTSSEITSCILMFWSKTQFWSTISYIITLLLQCFIILTVTNMSITDVTDINSYYKYIIDLYHNGLFLFIYLLIILIIYSYSIYHSNERIKENEMSKGWTYRSWIIGWIMLIITYYLSNHIPNLIKKEVKLHESSYITILCHILLIFVYIQYIISYYYQTDGFMSL